MERLKQYSDTELLKLINDAERDHVDLKQKIGKVLNRLKEVEDELNTKLDVLDSVEQRYITLITELNNRGK